MPREIKTEIQINAPSSSVWQVLTDFPRYPEWNPFILEVLGNVHQDASVKYRFQFPPGIRIWATAKILTFERQKELRWAAHFLTPALFNGEHYFAIEPVNENSILFHHGEIFTGVLVPLVQPLLRKYGPQSYQGLNIALQKRVESLLKTQATSTA